jgi:hypothetical protein
MPEVIPILADLGWALIALFLAIFVRQIGHLMAQLLQHIPLVGGAIAGAVQAATDGASRWLLSQWHGGWAWLVYLSSDMLWLSNAVGSGIIGFSGWIAGTASFMQHTQIPETGKHAAAVGVAAAGAVGVAAGRRLDHHAQEIGSLQNGAYAVVHHTIPNAIATSELYARTEATSAYNNAVAKSAGLVNGLAATMNKDLASVWSAIRPLQTQVAVTLPKDIAQVAAADRAALQAQAQAEAAALAAQATALSQDIAAASAAGATALAKAQAQEQANLTSAVASIDARIGIDEGNIAGLDQVVEVAIPATIAGLATQVASITTEIEQCMVSTCGGANSLENALKGLLGAFTITGELGFLASAISDPEATALAISQVVDPIYGEAQGIWNALLSL